MRRVNSKFNYVLKRFNKKCVDFAESDGKLYVLSDKRLYCFSQKAMLFSVPLISDECNKICICKKVFISAQGKSIYVYSKNGKLEELITVGEHINDMCTDFNAVFVVSYHDNCIFKIFDGIVCEKIQLSCMPDSILFNKQIYCLGHDEFFSYIFLIDKNLKILKKLTCMRGIEKIYLKNDNLIFNSFDYRYEIFPDLRIKSIKKHRRKPV